MSQKRPTTLQCQKRPTTRDRQRRERDYGETEEREGDRGERERQRRERERLRGLAETLLVCSFRWLWSKNILSAAKKIKNKKIAGLHVPLALVQEYTVRCHVETHSHSLQTKP